MGDPLVCTIFNEPTPKALSDPICQVAFPISTSPANVLLPFNWMIPGDEAVPAVSGPPVPVIFPLTISVLPVAGNNENELLSISILPFIVRVWAVVIANPAGMAALFPATLLVTLMSRLNVAADDPP